jgi:hypothetical protein
MEIDPRLFAKKLTSFEYDQFKKVTIYECLDQIWGDKRKKELSQIEGASLNHKMESGIARMIKHTNHVQLRNLISAYHVDMHKDFGKR